VASATASFHSSTSHAPSVRFPGRKPQFQGLSLRSASRFEATTTEELRVLAEAMTALASAAGAAVVNAAGTDAWESFRRQVARWFARGDHRREPAELERLDKTAADLEAIDAGGDERARIRLEALWQARVEGLLESLEQAEREQAATQLRGILDEQAKVSPSVSAGPGGLAAGGKVVIRADGGSIAGGVIHGGASIGNPRQPAPS
jgi:hypothetical protein